MNVKIIRAFHTVLNPRLTLLKSLLLNPGTETFFHTCHLEVGFIDGYRHCAMYKQSFQRLRGKMSNGDRKLMNWREEEIVLFLPLFSPKSLFRKYLIVQM